MKHIVKRKGHEEKYDEKKVYASVYAAALNCHYDEKKSEKIALEVMRKVNAWVKTKKSCNSSQIRDQIIKNLRDKDVALMYTHHLDIC